MTPITYIPNFIVDPTSSFNSLSNELDWEQREAPRQEYYSNDFPKPYIYGVGRGQREYLPKPWHTVMLDIRKQLEELTSSTFEVCFLNRYLNQKDQLGWHADDSPEMDDERPIAIISLGVEREIWFREKNNPGAIDKLKLGNGSLCLMHKGMQDTWQHRIPKASFQCGERISLTFRGYVNLDP
jgi:alkylated DNA repair dioxygenase AlkB